MPWIWRYQDVDGRPVDGPAETFSSQADAEAWIGQAVRESAAACFTHVTLVEDGRVDYQMSLLPAE